MTGKEAEAQQLTIHILAQLEAAQANAVYKKARDKLKENLSAQEQLQLCAMMAGELREKPNQYTQFDQIAKTIIARKTNREPWDVQKQEIQRELGFAENNRKSIGRIIDGSREIRMDEVERLCDGFTMGSNRLFWRNQLYGFFSYLLMEDTTGGPVLHCLRAVWDCLTEKQQAILNAFPQYASWREKLRPDRGNELYNTLEEKATQKELSSILGIDEDTYRGYKKAWTDYKAAGIGKYPQITRLSRDRLLRLAIGLNMTFGEAAKLMALGGYSFQPTETDRRVAEYLRSADSKAKEAEKNEILGLLKDK